MKFPSLEDRFATFPSAARLVALSFFICACAHALEPAATPPGTGIAEAQGPALVSRDLGDPLMNRWVEGDWVTCGGSAEALDERPDAPDAQPGASALRLKMRSPARAHGGWNCSLADNAGFIPGRFDHLSLWIRRCDEHPKIWGLSVNFRDANTNSFSIGIPFSDIGGEWRRLEFRPPEKVKRKNPETGREEHVPLAHPVVLTGLSMDNWFDRNNPESVERVVDVFDLRAHADLGDVPLEDRPWTLSTSFTAPANVFYAGEDEPAMRISGGSWIGEARTVTGSVTVRSLGGEERSIALPPLDVKDGAAEVVPLPFREPGAYTAVVRLDGFGDTFEETHRYAVTPRPPELSPEQRKASSYGLNVHGGGNVGYDNFARIGMVWLRDYAFDYNWMNRARGHGDFAGWPNYPRIVATAESYGFEILPCLKNAIQFDPVKKEGDREPTPEWRRNIARIVASFPELSCFELDNEKDTVKSDFPETYLAYHRAFGEIMKAVRPDALAVQEGAAGIDLEATRKAVLNGDFRDIDVCDGHRYCGIDAPEVSRSNANTGRGEDRKIYLRDMWRQWKKAACADGRDRELWLTEWGWDTRAGQIVSELEQAAYLQRKWVLALGNGVDKLFWYYHYDENTDTPSVFFDGCGLFDRHREPKPAAAAFAALRSFLPADMEYVGYATLGPNHMAHVLKLADGSLAAMAFKIRASSKLGTVPAKFADMTIRDPKAARVCDMFGRELKPGRRTLGLDPTWYFGLDPDCDWVGQCPMDLESDFFVRNVAGEPIRVRVKDAPECRYDVKAPRGWTVKQVDGGFDVTVPFGTPRGPAAFTVVGRGRRAEKTMSVDVDIVPQAFVKSHATSFDGIFEVDVVNQSSGPQSFLVRGDLPPGWEISPAEAATPELQPDESSTLRFRLVSTTEIPASEARAIPRLVVLNAGLGQDGADGGGAVLDTAPIVPREWTMHAIRPGDVAIDGDLGDWTDRHRLSGWMLGPRGDAEKSRIFAGWAPNGLYLAFDVRDSQCKTSDPRSFWRAADCIEVQFSAPGATFSEAAGWTPHDHQFWFCPLADENRVYSGLWPNCPEQSAGLPKGVWAHYDMQDVRSAMRKDDDGYTMELFIPASRLGGWGAPKVGDVAGAMFSLAIQGHRDPREAYWPASKAEGAVKKPWTWARIHLAE